MKQIFNNILGRAAQRGAAVACAAALLLFAGCVRDLETDADGGVNTDGDFELSLSLAVPSADARTRNQSIDDKGIETLWIGVFATTPSSNGELNGESVLVKTWDMYNLILPEDNTNTVNLTFSINKYEKEMLNAKLQSWFGDPTLDYTKVKFHFSAIANFKNVKAQATMLRNFGEGELNASVNTYELTETTELVYILRSLNTWREFCSIIIDAQSAFEQRYPLMEGALGSGGDAASQMIRPEDFTLQNDAAGTKYTHVYSMSDLIAIKNSTTNKIRMRRIISDVNVVLTADFGGTQSDKERYESVSIKNVRYSVVNYPKAFYLQERLMAEDPNNLRNIPDTKTILSDAELFEKYAPSVENFYNPADGYWMTADNAQTYSVPGEYSWTMGGSNQQVFNFNFIRYENKHSGLSTTEHPLTKYTDREEVGDNGLFTALCPDGVLENNNYAPYFVIMADMEVVMAGKAEPLNIAARYVIHEGYCNNYEGGAQAENLHDFSCVRNTKYTYNVKITGVNSILVSVKVTDQGESRPGVTGDVSSVIENVVFDGDANVTEGNTTFTLTNAQRKELDGKWLVVAPWRAKIDGEWVYKHVEFGYNSIKVPQTSLVKSYGGDDFYSVEGRELINQFTTWVWFTDAKGNPKTIGQFASELEDIEGEGDDVEHTYTVKVTDIYSWKSAYDYAFDADSEELAKTDVRQPSWSNPDEDARALWFCTEIKTGPDGSTYQKIMSVTQTVKDERPSLPAPEVTGCSSPVYVYEGAEIAWNVAAEAEDREGVDHYVVSVNGETFTEEFDPAGNTRRFTPPVSVEYGEKQVFSAVSYPQYAAEYLPSEELKYEYTVFRRSNTWSLGAKAYPGITTTQETYTDWRELSNTLEVTGANIRQDLTNGFVQIGSMGSNIDTNPTNTFRMLIPESGWIHVIFSNTGNNASNGARKVAVSANGQEFVSRRSSSSVSQVEAWFYIGDVTEPTYVYIYSPSENGGGLRYYEIEYTQNHEETTQWTWNFSDDEWLDVFAKAAPGAEENNATGWTVSLNGLTYTSGTGNGKWGYESSLDRWYIQPNGAGSTTTRVFSFTAPYAGTLRITARSASSGSVRNVTVVSGGKTQSIGVDELTELTFNVAEGEVLVYPSAGIRFYEFELDCSSDPVEPEPGPASWDFASSAWSSVINDLAALGDAGSTTIDVTIDGLRLVAGGANIRANKDGGYIQPNGAGSKTKRCFSFKATTDGTLRVTAQSANATETRDVTVEDGKTTQSKGALTKTVLEFSISAGDIYIYPGGGMRFYSIEFDGGVQK